MIKFWEDKFHLGNYAYNIMNFKTRSDHDYITVYSPVHGSISIMIGNVKIDMIFLERGFKI